ncbi:cuticle protein 8-like isoform X3 [Macrobrachium rosenbergii]|uniref:cuticle protein 8-like isoform X3 n=1 Tax=Macrobrachium rosenbergii TaxID=79674 RepID=UPI0034D52714
MKVWAVTFLGMFLVVGMTLGAPQYNYDIPQSPSTLYETPAESVQEPVQLYEEPEETVQEPVQLYEAPSNNILVAEPQNIVPNIVSPPSPPMEGMPYDFTWGVEDAESGNTFSHVENSDGQRTEGEYRVLLPDGRLQIVRFFDIGEGFNAEVTYEK